MTFHRQEKMLIARYKFSLVSFSKSLKIYKILVKELLTMIYFNKKFAKTHGLLTAILSINFEKENL